VDLKFVEAGQSETRSFNWGKFAVGRPTNQEWAEPIRFPGCGSFASLLESQGWTQQHIFVFDLSTGEGAMFYPYGLVSANINQHRIWACPLFEPFLEWLYAFIRRNTDIWWNELPRTVVLPDAPAQIYGIRFNEWTTQ